MKKLFIASLFLVMGFMAWACNRLPVSPSGMTTPTPTLTSTSTPIFTATPTATLNLTPVCGFTPVTMGNLSYLNMNWPPAGTPVPATTPGTSYVVPIRSLADWQTFYQKVTPPTPPVDFSTQMIIVYAYTTICDFTTYGIQSVCEGPTQVTVEETTMTSTILCNAVDGIYTPLAVAVPQSNLPVLLVQTTGSIFPSGNLTPIVISIPTATATP